MATGYLNAEEQQVLRYVAELFENDAGWIFSEKHSEDRGMDHQKFKVILKRLHSFGAVEDLQAAGEEIACMPAAHAVDLVRELDQRREQEATAQPDLIEQIRAAARRKPVIAWTIIGVAILTVAVTLANGAWDLIAKIVGLFG